MSVQVNVLPDLQIDHLLFSQFHAHPRNRILLFPSIENRGIFWPQKKKEKSFVLYPCRNGLTQLYPPTKADRRTPGRSMITSSQRKFNYKIAAKVSFQSKYDEPCRGFNQFLTLSSVIAKTNRLNQRPFLPSRKALFRK